jgi:excisionase family DNA binding protein
MSASGHIRPTESARPQDLAEQSLQQIEPADASLSAPAETSMMNESFSMFDQGTTVQDERERSSCRKPRLPYLQRARVDSQAFISPPGGHDLAAPDGLTRALPVLLTVDDVATLLRTTRRAIYAMVERGQLPGVIRIRRRVLVRTAVLLHWLDQKRAPSPDE